jgi:tetratricopeptide (TPR) repeat protein
VVPGYLRLIIVLMIVGLVDVRTVAIRTQGSPRANPDIARSVTPGRRVIFVGLDGADWSLLDRYIARGMMPHLARLVTEGTSGHLRTMDPPLSPLLWTTMMTGASPLAHRILDFAQFDPATGQKEPITSSERRVPAIWNMTTVAGKHSAVFGLWATYPAEPVNGLMVSDRLFSFLFRGPTPVAHVVFPREREAWARDAVTRADRAIDYAALRAYLPWLSEADYRAAGRSKNPYAEPVSALRRILVEERVYRELALDWIQSQSPDLTIVYVEATDAIGHVFAPYAPPRQASIAEQDYERYRTVPDRFFQAIDTTIGRFADAAKSSGAVLMIASDHGFFWNEGRPAASGSGNTVNAATWHAPEGLYLLWGAGIGASGGHNARGSIHQVAATLLALLGLPPGRDVDGQPLDGVNATSGPHADYAAHYRPSQPPVQSPVRAVFDAEALENLRSLGYTSGGGASPGDGSTRTPESYNNEGGFLQSRGKMVEAIRAFEKALSLDPSLLSAQRNLSELWHARGQNLDRSDGLLVSAFAGGLPGGGKYLADRAAAYERAGQMPRGVKLLNAAVRVKPRDAELWRFRGGYLLAAKDCKGASASFDRAIALAPNHAATHAGRGEASLCLGDRAAAGVAFRRSLEIDPNQPTVRQRLHDIGSRE